MGRKNKVILQPIKFRRHNHVAILSQNDPSLDEIVREFENVEWSTGYRFWHLPLEVGTVDMIVDALKKIAIVDSSALDGVEIEIEKDGDRKKNRHRVKTGSSTPEQIEKLEKFKIDFLAKGYSEGTMKIYVCLLKVFFGWFSHKPDTEITKEDVHSFLEGYIEKNNFTVNYRRLMTNALRRYFTYIGKERLF